MTDCESLKRLSGAAVRQRAERGNLARSATAFGEPASGCPRPITMRAVDTIDAEPRLIAVVRWSIREHGDMASAGAADQLLDERLEIRTSAASSNV